MSVPDEQFNTESIESKYSEVVLPNGEPIHPHDKYAEFSIICYCPYNDIKFPKWSCVINCCI